MEPEPTLDDLRAILSAFPELNGLEFTLLTQGYDFLAVDVGNRWIFKFPRDTEAEKPLVTESRLLPLVRRAVAMPVPETRLYFGPPLFSRREKILGEHLLGHEYERLSEANKWHLGADLALFYAQLHGLDAGEVEAAGAEPIEAFVAPDEMLRRIWPLVSSDLREYAERTVGDWQRLETDPYGAIFGFFDGHGWNMAFDHVRGRLNGIYDFCDSGFGALHQEFIYSNWISPDLTARIVAEYEILTGRDLDRERIHILSGIIRLSELAHAADDPHERPRALKTLIDWVERTEPRT